MSELGTIAASVGNVMHHLAAHPDLFRALRAGRAVLRDAIDEIALSADSPPERAIYPGSGFRSLPVRVRCSDRAEA
ncbi:MAG: hypothetical protein WD942_08235 [Dehalococcoidia bacterium]